MKRRLLTLVAATVSLGAYAQQPIGPYLGASLGSTDIRLDLGEGDSYSTDKFTWGVNAGWQINQYFGVEAGYMKPRAIKESFGEDSVTGKFSAWSATILATYPLSERWSIHARLGGIVATEKYSGVFDGLGFSYSDDTSEVLYGIGVGVIVEGAKLRLDYQRAKFDYGKAQILSLGINWYLPVSP